MTALLTRSSVCGSVLKHRNAAAADAGATALHFPWLWPHPLALDSCLLLLQIDLSLMRVRTAVKK